MQLSIDVHGHYAGRDFMLCNKPIEARLAGLTEHDVFTANAVSVDSGELLSFNEYRITESWTGTDYRIIVAFFTTQTSVRIDFHTLDRDVMKTYSFDVVEQVRFSDDHKLARAALARILRQNEEMTQRMDVMLLMYHKMCEMLVQVSEHASPPQRKRKRAAPQQPCTVNDNLVVEEVAGLSGGLS